MFFIQKQGAEITEESCNVGLKKKLMSLLTS